MKSKENLPKFTFLQISKFAYQLLRYLDESITEDKVKKMNLNFQEYKHKITVCGAIIYNQDRSKVLLICPSSQNNTVKVGWTFPKGKINQGETEVECAVREVWEEIGFKMNDLINPSHYCDYSKSGKLTRLFIITGVKETTKFVTKSIGEVDKIQWFSISEIKKNPTFQKVVLVLNKVNRVPPNGQSYSPLVLNKKNVPYTNEEIEKELLQAMNPPLSNLEIEKQFSTVLFPKEEKDDLIESLLNIKKKPKKLILQKDKKEPTIEDLLF